MKSLAHFYFIGQLIYMLMENLENLATALLVSMTWFLDFLSSGWLYMTSGVASRGRLRRCPLRLSHSGAGACARKGHTGRDERIMNSHYK